MMAAGSSVITQNGTVVISSRFPKEHNKRIIYFLNLDGTLKGKFITDEGAGTYCWPVVAPDGTIVVATSNSSNFFGYLYFFK